MPWPIADFSSITIRTPRWQQLRREDPVHWTEGLGRPFWSLTRYADIVAAFSEPNLFNSTRGLFVA